MRKSLTFRFDNRLPIINFLNEKGITLLKFINEQPQLLCKNLIEEISKMSIMKRSSVFRYIKCFLRYDLIDKSDRKRKEDGYIKYKISDKGIKALKFLLKNFQD